MRELRLFKNCQGFTFKQSLRNRVTCWALGDVLTFEYCCQATSKLDPFFRRSVIEERYGELVERRSRVCGGGCVACRRKTAHIQAVWGQVLGTE
eukprot:6115770-Ditylum_brightwellii.AAC.1